MTLRRLTPLFVLAAALAPRAAHAAHYETTNFSVEAPSAELAKKFGDMAEHFRREKALDWLGREMPNWPRKCPLRVIVSMTGTGGATTFQFGSANGRPVVASQEMEIRGEVNQLLHSVLPHEVTHTVLAHRFGRPVPRWADEGGSVLSENTEERFSHDVKCRELLNIGKGIRLRVLFKMTEYPREMFVLYAQGYSVSSYLVEKGGGGREGRQTLLKFLDTGMQGNTVESWNAAARTCYGFATVDELEVAWLDGLKAPPSRQVAAAIGRTTPREREAPAAAAEYAATTTSNPRTDVRSSAAPALALLEPPVSARGAAPDAEPTTRSDRRVAPAAAAVAPKKAMAPDRPLNLLGVPEVVPPRP